MFTISWKETIANTKEIMYYIWGYWEKPFYTMNPESDKHLLKCEASEKKKKKLQLQSYKGVILVFPFKISNLIVS